MATPAVFSEFANFHSPVVFLPYVTVSLIHRFPLAMSSILVRNSTTPSFEHIHGYSTKKGGPTKR